MIQTALHLHAQGTQLSNGWCNPSHHYELVTTFSHYDSRHPQSYLVLRFTRIPHRFWSKGCGHPHHVWSNDWAQPHQLLEDRERKVGVGALPPFSCHLSGWYDHVSLKSTNLGVQRGPCTNGYTNQHVRYSKRRRGMRYRKDHA